MKHKIILRGLNNFYLPKLNEFFNFFFHKFLKLEINIIFNFVFMI